MNSVEFLDAAQVALGVDSDNKLATALDVPRDRISKVRTGARKLDDNLAIKIAGAIGVEPIVVMLEVQAERAPVHEIKVIWREAAERLLAAAKKGKAAVWALVAITLLSNVPSDQARAGAASADQNLVNGLYIMRIWLFIQWFARVLARLYVVDSPQYRRRRRQSVTRVTFGGVDRRYGATHLHGAMP